MSMRIEIRGVTYPNTTAAAKALGVTRHAIYKALDKGAADTIGTKRRKVTVDGVEYPSFTAAQNALGLTSTYITNLVQRNKTGRWVSPSGMVFEWSVLE